MTAKAGVGDPGFSTSAAWFDYDSDGRLDLFVANYVEWTLETDLHCTLDGDEQVLLHAASRTRGRARRCIATAATARSRTSPSARGSTTRRPRRSASRMLDYDGDGWLDLFVANDTQPNRLYRNNGNGTFEDVA